jgi:hypothetical protein
MTHVVNKDWLLGFLAGIYFGLVIARHWANWNDAAGRIDGEAPDAGPGTAQLASDIVTTGDSCSAPPSRMTSDDEEDTRG